MTLTFSSLDELNATKKALDKLREDHPNLFEKVVHVVNLTRALQFKYQYLGSLLLDEKAGNYAPQFVKGSVLRLYKKEIKIVKDDNEFLALKRIFEDFKEGGYSKICLLIIGMSPESLLGAPIIK